MENPYASPTSSVVSMPTEVTIAELASRSKRFAAAMIDGLVLAPIGFAFSYSTGMLEYAKKGGVAPFELVLASCVFGFVIYAALNGYLLSKYGQSIGKRVMKIKIISFEGGQASLARILVLRFLPIQLTSLIQPYGFFLALLDVFFIFGKERQCLHDHIAGTKVVNV